MEKRRSLIVLVEVLFFMFAFYFYSNDLLVYFIKKRINFAVKLMIKIFPPLVNSEFDGASPLTKYIVIDDYEMVNFLIEHGANVNQKLTKGQNNNYTYPILSAGFSNEKKVIKLLLKAGADINQLNSKGESVLESVVSTGDIESARALMELGADAWLDNGRYDPLMASTVLCQDFKMAKMFIEMGADVNKIYGSMKSTLLIEAARLNCKPVIEFLLKNGAKTEVHDDIGETPLICAIIDADSGAVKMLVEGGADVNYAVDGLVPYNLAVNHGKTEIAKYLAEKGAKTNVGKTAR